MRNFGLKIGFAALLSCFSFLFAANIATSTNKATKQAKANFSIAYDAILFNGFNIRHLRREIVGENTRLYTDTGSIDVPTAQIERYDEVQVPIQVKTSADVKSANLPEIVQSASDKHQIDPDLINAVIHAESNFQSNAVSRTGAQGLMQLMPGTANQLGVADAFEPNSNVDGGTRYLSELLDRYNGDMVKALAAYNAGPKRVEQYKGVPPYRETRAYIARIVREFNSKKIAQNRALAVKNQTLKHSKTAKQQNALPTMAATKSKSAPTVD